MDPQRAALPASVPVFRHVLPAARLHRRVLISPSRSQSLTDGAPSPVTDSTLCLAFSSSAASTPPPAPETSPMSSKGEPPPPSLLSQLHSLSRSHPLLPSKVWSPYSLRRSCSSQPPCKLQPVSRPLFFVQPPLLQSSRARRPTSAFRATSPRRRTRVVAIVPSESRRSSPPAALDPAPAVVSMPSPLARAALAFQIRFAFASPSSPPRTSRAQHPPLPAMQLRFRRVPLPARRRRCLLRYVSPQPPTPPFPVNRPSIPLMSDITLLLHVGTAVTSKVPG